MNPTESIFREALSEAGVDLPEPSGPQRVGLVAEQIEAILRSAYDAGMRESRRSLFNEEDEMPKQLFRQLMETLPDRVYFKNLQSRFIGVNRAMAVYFGFNDPAEMVALSDFELFPVEHAILKFEVEQRIIATGEGWTWREDIDHRPGKEISYVITSKLPLYDANGRICGTFGLSRDITKQRHAEMEVARHRRLLETILQILPCRLFLRDLEGRFLMVNEEYMRCLDRHDAGSIIGLKLEEVLPNNVNAQSIAEEDRQVLATGEAIRNKLEYDRSALRGNRWVLTSKVPFRSESGEARGIVGMTLDITEQKRAEDTARRVKEALEAKNQQFEAELLVARELQEQLMAMGFGPSRVFERASDAWSLQASYLYRPSHHLAGDFFYLLPISELKLGLLVCDVMGQGVKAALVTMLIRGLISDIPSLLDQPSRVLQHLNAAITSLAADEEFPRFVTAAYLTIDLRDGAIVWANAGHPKPLYRELGSGEGFADCPCAAVGSALGLVASEQFPETRFLVAGAAELCLFTDGAIDQSTREGMPFGKDGLIAALEAGAGRDWKERLEFVRSKLESSLSDASASDDICLVGLSMTPIGR